MIKIRIASCPGPLKKFEVESTRNRNRLGSIGSTGSTTHSSGSKIASGSSDIDVEILREMREQTIAIKKISSSMDDIAASIKRFVERNLYLLELVACQNSLHFVSMPEYLLQVLEDLVI